jgi:hypothetical protein
MNLHFPDTSVQIGHLLFWDVGMSLFAMLPPFDQCFQLIRGNPSKESLAFSAVQTCFLWLPARPGATFW